MSEWVLLPWDFIILKKEEIERAEVFHDEKGFGVAIHFINKDNNPFGGVAERWQFKSKKMAQKMFLEFHKRLLDE